MNKKYQQSFIITLLMVIFETTAVFSQSTTDNNAWAGNKFLGWNASNGTNPLFTRTNDINRMRLNGNQTALISFVPQNTSGYLGISPNGAAG